jgi:iron complex outermembrane receptor protein
LRARAGRRSITGITALLGLTALAAAVRADAAEVPAPALTGAPAAEEPASPADPDDAPEPTTPAPALHPTTVRSHRIPEDLVEVPAAVGVVDGAEARLVRQQLALDEALHRVPGLFVQNRNNFAQDLRISTRGFGARSSFGIRGVKLYVDGIPATLPDGQTQVDDIEIGAIQHIEVMRGPASSLYGPAAGGVIGIFSDEPPEQPFVEGRLSFGSYGFQRYQLQGGGQLKRFGATLNGSHTRIDGYREQSRARSSLLHSKLVVDIDTSSDLSLVVGAVHSPLAEDAGGLTRQEVEEDRHQASPRNLLFDAGESVDQQRLGLVYRKSFGAAHEVAARGYGLHRDFDNRLPFVTGGSVDLGRIVAGGGAGYAWTHQVFERANRLALGFDVDAQRDRRKRFDNDFGTRGPLGFDQDEDVTGVGVYLQDRLELGWDLDLVAGARYDRVEFDVTDRYLADGDDSGRTHFDDVSPAVGLLWSPLSALHLYFDFSTSFETPTTTELANPSGGGGFNRSLQPARARNLEIGAKGLLPGRLRYGLALFHIAVEDELVPFERSDMPGRIFFQNAGESTRRGLELDLTAEPITGLTATLAYTFSDFRFDRYQTPQGVFDGNRLPGVPKHLLFAELAARHPSGLWIAWEARYVGAFFANDANTVRTDPYWVSSLRLGHTLRVRRLEISPFFGVNNLFDEDYEDNVRINAAAGRYFEPAPTRNVYGGVTIRYGFGD